MSRRTSFGGSMFRFERELAYRHDRQQSDPGAAMSKERDKPWAASAAIGEPEIERPRRGSSKAMQRVDDDRRELGRGERMIILAGREALVAMIERYCAGARDLDPRKLRLVAISGLFADAISGLAGTRLAPQLLEAVNRQLEQSGLQVVPTVRN